jgi:glycosyltransferase involved in cell wall biosynthesis
MSSPNAFQRARQIQRLLKSEGRAGVGARLRNRAAEWIAPAADARLPVSRDDLLRAADVAANGCVPQTGGAGGFTTLYRLASALERGGHHCVIYLHDRHGWSIDQHRRTMQAWWPTLQAEIRDVADGIEDAHAIFATSWETAYPVLASPARGARCYLVQDFEPLFYAAGSNALLAEATYRFGFHGLTAGPWLAQLLHDRYGMATDSFEFGADSEHYALDPASERTGVCMYARPSTPRRAFELGVAALDLFAERHPDVDIHLYGETIRGLPFDVSNHGLLTPTELNALYNRCVAGLVLSATNVSLVPHEMLAAGCIPVVNDAEQNRTVLDNPHVAYVAATPFGLADALSALVERSAEERDAAAAEASASVMGASWDDAGATVERVIKELVTGGDPARAHASAAASGALFE